MMYVSTRGSAPALGFRDTVLAGLARDGGLYVPRDWPTLSVAEIAALGQKSYGEIAVAIMERFVGDEISRETLVAMVEDSYGSFSHKAVTPLRQLDSNLFMLELFHGPTLAFKDVAMQFLARLSDHILTENGQDATIVGATSGDTGGAAIEAFRGRERVKIAILFPDGRVSGVQRRQMTTVKDANVRAIAIEGDFDDAQRLVKEMFADFSFRDSVGLMAVNSINWGRILAQTVYYFAAAVALGAPHRPVSFTVPTGNFGNIFAGFAARKMGLPIERLVVATNINDILHRTLETGRYERRTTVPTQSPSMDIQVSSNFERLLYFAEQCDSDRVARHMSGLAQGGAFSVEPPALEAMADLFQSGRSTEADTRATIARMRSESNIIVDPHTAVGIHVAERLREPEVPMVTLATAHPAKFPDAVETACGLRPQLPERCSGLMEAEENYEVLRADLTEVEAAIGTFVADREPAGQLP